MSLPEKNALVFGGTEIPALALWAGRPCQKSMVLTAGSMFLMAIHSDTYVPIEISLA